MALHHLVSGTVSSSEIVFIKDSLAYPSRSLTDHILTSWCSNSSISIVTVVCLDLSPSYYTKLLSKFTNQNKKLIIVDLSTDPLGWRQLENTQNSVVQTLPATQLDAIKSTLLKIGSPNQSSVLFFDSIASFFLYGHTADSLAAFLNEVKYSKQSNFSSIFSVLHQDIVPSIKSVHILESIATAILETTQMPVLPAVEISGSFKVLQKRKTGKVSRISEHYLVSKGNVLTFYTESQVIRKQVGPEKSEEQTKAELGIDQLTPAQEAARASVALPYIKAQEYASTSVSGLPEASLDRPAGSIFLDDDDDAFAGSDPDDDLDI